jgi:tripeptide aminopeptidase
MKKEDSIISPKIKTFLRSQARDCFLRYVTIHTSSNPDSQSCPSTIGQLELAELLKQGLSELELENIELDNCGYLYAVLLHHQGQKDLP